MFVEVYFQHFIVAVLNWHYGGLYMFCKSPKKHQAPINFNHSSSCTFLGGLRQCTYALFDDSFAHHKVPSITHIHCQI